MSEPIMRREHSALEHRTGVNVRTMDWKSTARRDGPPLKVTCKCGGKMADLPIGVTLSRINKAETQATMLVCDKCGNQVIAHLGNG